MRQHLVEDSIEKAIVGGALGWDTLFARAAFLAKVPFDLYVPFEGQEMNWPTPARERYYMMRHYADKVIVVCEGGYSREKMQLRNMAMVNNSEAVWALWDGSEGGTKNCLEYAWALERPWKNFYSSSLL